MVDMFQLYILVVNVPARRMRELFGAPKHPTIG